MITKFLPVLLLTTLVVINGVMAQSTSKATNKAVPYSVAGKKAQVYPTTANTP